MRKNLIFDILQEAGALFVWQWHQFPQISHRQAWNHLTWCHFQSDWATVTIVWSKSKHYEIDWAKSKISIFISAKAKEKRILYLWCQLRSLIVLIKKEMRRTNQNMGGGWKGWRGGRGRSRRVSREGGIDSVQSVTECDDKPKEMGMKRGKRGKKGGETGKKWRSNGTMDWEWAKRGKGKVAGKTMRSMDRVLSH